MSTTSLSNIQEVIERTVFERVRLELVDKGYLPDITIYQDPNIYPDPKLGGIAYQTALKSIANSNKRFAIELFGASNQFSKGTEKVPRIVIKGKNGLPGALGGDSSKMYEDKDTYYEVSVLPPQTTDFYLDVILSSNTIEQDRILQSIVALALPKRGYIPLYNDSTRNFFIRYISYYDDEDAPQGILIKVYGYEIPDAWDVNPTILTDHIAKMTDITLEIETEKP